MKNAFVYDPNKDINPVTLSKSSKERRYLNAKRSFDELLDFVYENGLIHALENALYNNDIGFGVIYMGEDYSIEEENGINWLNIPYVEGSIQMSSVGELPCDVLDKVAFIFKTGVGDMVEFQCIFLEKDKSFMINSILVILLESAGIDSYWKLGKFINKTTKIMHINEATSILQALKEQRMVPIVGEDSNGRKVDMGFIDMNAISFF